MKKLLFVLFAVLSVSYSWGQAKDAAYYRAKGYQVFNQFGVAVKAKKDKFLC